MKRLALPIALALVLMVCAGCASTPQPQPLDILADPTALTPPQPVESDQLFPLLPRRGSYRIWEGPQAGEHLSWTLHPQNSHWQFDCVGFQSTLLLRDTQGNLLVQQEEDLSEQVRVNYEPPLVLLPAKLEPGSVVEAQVSMTVRRLADASLVAQGTCRYRLELLGQQTLRTEAGIFHTTLVAMERWINLPLAKVWVRTITAYAPEVGQVAERTERLTWMLGLIPSAHVWEIRLAR